MSRYHERRFIFAALVTFLNFFFAVIGTSTVNRFSNGVPLFIPGGVLGLLGMWTHNRFGKRCTKTQNCGAYPHRKPDDFR